MRTPAPIPTPSVCQSILIEPPVGVSGLSLGGGWVAGVVVSTGPLTVPLFAFYGLERGAFLGTEAASSLGMYAAKAATFRALGALPLELLFHGLAVGATLMAGSFAGRFVVLRLSPASYRSLIDGLMAISGISLLWVAFR